MIASAPCGPRSLAWPGQPRIAGISRLPDTRIPTATSRNDNAANAIRCASSARITTRNVLPKPCPTGSAPPRRRRPISNPDQPKRAAIAGASRFVFGLSCQMAKTLCDLHKAQILIRRKRQHRNAKRPQRSAPPPTAETNAPMNQRPDMHGQADCAVEMRPGKKLQPAHPGSGRQPRPVLAAGNAELPRHTGQVPTGMKMA